MAQTELEYEPWDRYIHHWLVLGPDLTGVTDLDHFGHPNEDLMKSNILKHFRLEQPEISRLPQEGLSAMIGGKSYPWRLFQCQEDHLVEFSRGGNCIYVKTYAFVRVKATTTIQGTYGMSLRLPAGAENCTIVLPTLLGETEARQRADAVIQAACLDRERFEAGVPVTVIWGDEFEKSARLNLALHNDRGEVLLSTNVIGRRNERIPIVPSTQLVPRPAMTRNRLPGPGVIQFRRQRVLPEPAGTLVLAAHKQYEPELSVGALVTVEQARSRVRVLPL